MVVRELITKLGFALDQGPLTQYEKSAEVVAKRMSNVGRSMTTFVTLPIVAAAGLAVKAFSEQNMAIAQVQKGLETTRNAAGKTVDELVSQAGRLQSTSLFGDEKILQEATAQLLTFTNIAGKEFDRTQQAVLDVSTRINGPNASLTSTAIQLGKALNDPIRNLSALSRSGIQFTDQQRAMIKNMVESGRLSEAQRIILTELERQYGGSAAAAAKASSGFKQMTNAIGDTAETFGEVLFPMIQAVTTAITKFAKWVATFPKWVKGVIIVVAALVAAIGPLLIAGAGILTMVTMLMAHGAIVMTVLTAVGGALMTIAGALVTIILPAAIILLILQDIMTWLQGGESVFGAFVGPVEDFMDNLVFWLDVIKRWFDSTWTGIVTSVTDFFNNVMFWVDKVAGFFSGVGGKIAAFLGFGQDMTGPAAAFAGAGAGGGTVSVVGGPISVSVPPGTTAEQAQNIADAVSAAVNASLTTHSRRVVKSNPVTE